MSERSADEPDSGGRGGEGREQSFLPKPVYTGSSDSSLSPSSCREESVRTGLLGDTGEAGGEGEVGEEEVEGEEVHGDAGSCDPQSAPLVGAELPLVLLEEEGDASHPAASLENDALPLESFLASSPSLLLPSPHRSLSRVGEEGVDEGGWCFLVFLLASLKLARGGRSLTPLRVEPSIAFCNFGPDNDVEEKSLWRAVRTDGSLRLSEDTVKDSQLTLEPWPGELGPLSKTLLSGESHQSNTAWSSVLSMEPRRIMDSTERALPDVPEGQLRQVRQLLHLDDGVVERRLQALGHHVCEDDGHHHGQDVRDLTEEEEDDEDADVRMKPCRGGTQAGRSRRS
ncbi:hypothetical protein EYF80_037889 [Liparis tanakae]|uniref:Uncharacterized protein n=1 Tax=Liparis tanakae TaxID=230148 RepID=A0A4Z2GEE2_9TELE|nr:hypothetical protein EYF80_037889 [Liparis tanakae]